MRERVGAGGLRYAAQRLALIAVFACLLFVSAGSVHWRRGWIYVIAALGIELLTLGSLAALAPRTLERRGSIGSGVASFDRWFAIAWGILALATPVVAGLDAVRFRCAPLPEALFLPALLVLIAASLFAGWAMVENEHFEQFVRIQTDRGHRVVATGPYRFVRHPGYLGAILGALATPLLLGSGWTFVPAIAVAALFVARTRLEDRTLRRELAGYDAYARRTRYRLLPLVW